MHSMRNIIFRVLVYGLQVYGQVMVGLLRTVRAVFRDRFIVRVWVVVRT